MVIAFGGWPDAKRVATYAAEYLIEKLGAEKIGEIEDSLKFYDFAIERPLIKIEEGLVKGYEFPKNELYMWKNNLGDHDLVILIGVEPHLNWSGYVDSIFHAVDFKKAYRVCLLGGLIDRIPHTVQSMISGVATRQELLEEMKLHGVESINYTGPSGIHSFILRESERRGVTAFSLWGHTPEYIGNVDSRTAHQLLCKVTSMLRIEVDLGDLRSEGNLLEKQLDGVMRRDQAFSQLVHRLEVEYNTARIRTGYIA
jgi:proteasome assembly chaperone (PAC2) family protein